jgi:DNA mismatch repair protein MutS2
LSEKRKQLKEKEHNLERREHSLEEERNRLEQEKESLAAREAVLKKEEVSELHSFLHESRRTLENLVRELREGEITKEKTRKVKQFLQEVTEKTQQEEQVAASLEEAIVPKQTSEEIREGIEVYVGKSKQRGTVLYRDRKGKWVIATNSMRIRANEKELVPVSQTRRNNSVDFSYSEVDSTPDYEIDVRGQRLEDALDLVRKQLDRAIISGLSEFHIIHGKGKGVLQQGIHDYLENSKDVKEYTFSHPSQGGFGKTIVKLDKK